MKKLLLVSIFFATTAGFSSCDRGHEDETSRVISPEEAGLVGEWRAVAYSMWGTVEGREVTYDTPDIAQTVDWRLTFSDDGNGAGFEIRLSNGQEYLYDFLWNLSNGRLVFTGMKYSGRNDLHLSSLPFGFLQSEFEVKELTSDRLAIYSRYRYRPTGGEYHDVVRSYGFERVN